MIRRCTLPFAALLLLAGITGHVLGGPLPLTESVSAEGNLVSASPALTRVSPSGGYSMRILPTQVGFDQFRVDLEVTSPDGATRRLSGMQGNGFFVSDLGRVVVLETAELNSRPSGLRVYDLDGRMLWDGTVEAPTNPTLSKDGRYLAVGVRGATVVLNLESFDTIRHPHLDLFAVGPGGLLAGISYHDQDALFIEGGGVPPRRLNMDFRARRIDLSSDGASLYVLGSAALVQLPTAAGNQQDTSSAMEVLYRAPAGAELQDFRLTTEGFFELGLRSSDGQVTQSERITLNPDGRTLRRDQGPSEPISRAQSQLSPASAIPWPISPNSQHPVGNTYGEYQNYGGAPYPHPGFDVMGSPYQPVYAVRSGVVKAILTTSAEYHWRVAVGDSVTAGPCLGYLYAHLNQASITVHVGDLITAGQQLGTLVQWPNDNFTHCHFTRIQDSGTTWDGLWLSVQNPHLDVNHTETAAPVFQRARGTDLLAFCANNTSSYQSPSGLHGAVDIIARVSDLIVSTWKCTVQELRYTIYPLGQPGSPVVNDKQSVFFNMNLDTYINGTNDAFLINLFYKQDSVCPTQGDYSAREFYHILTNSNGDQIYDASDMNQAWNTAVLPDGNYVIRVKAIDAAGNVAVDSMVVTTANGNPSETDDGRFTAGPLTCQPNPASEKATIGFTLSQPGMVALTIYDPTGRLVRRVFDGRLPQGMGNLIWNGRDARGERVPAGIYLYRLQGDGRDRSGRLVVVH